MLSRLIVLPILFAILLAPAAASAATPFTPDRVVKSLNFSVNQKKSPCSWMTRDMRNFIATSFFPMLILEDKQGKPIDFSKPENWTEANRAMICNNFINIYNSYVEDSGMPEWKRTELSKVKVIAVKGNLAHVRARVSHQFRDKKDNISYTGNVFLVKSNNLWRVADPSPVIYLLASKSMPKNIDSWWPYYRKMKKQFAAAEANLQKIFTTRKQATSTVSSSLASCPGKGSGGSDDKNDVFFGSGGDLIPNQDKATVDIVDSKLSNEPPGLCLSVSFDSPTSDNFYLALNLYQQKNEELLAELMFAFEDGQVLSYNGEKAIKAEVARSGNQVSVLISSEQLKKLFADKSILWRLQTFQINPEGRGDYLYWMDEAPALGDKVRGYSHDLS